MTTPVIPEDVTDIHLRFVEGELRLEDCLMFPGGLPLRDDLVELAKFLAKICQSKDDEEIAIACLGRVIRAQRDDTTVDGIWYRCRFGLGECRGLDHLPSPLPASIVNALLDPLLSGGGLILVTGGPGSGKTTTASATVVSRLQTEGGIAFTVEDPPEYLLNGRHGEGVCSQRNVVRHADGAPNWEFTIRRILRSQPVSSNLMLFVGEMRDRGAARMAVRAAANGFLVITTAFASDLVNGVSSFCSLFDDHLLQAQFASLLRVVLYQRITHQGRINVDMLTNSQNDPVAQYIKSGRFSLLHDQVELQRNQRSRTRQAVGGQCG